MSFKSRIEEIVTEAVENRLVELVKLHGTESEMGHYNSLMIMDDDLKFNTESGRWIEEITETSLIDNCGYSYGFYGILDTEQLLSIVDHLIDRYNIKELNKYKNSTCDGKLIKHLLINSENNIFAFTIDGEKYNLGYYDGNVDGKYDHKGDYILCSIQTNMYINVNK